MRSYVISIGIAWIFLLLGCAGAQREYIPAENIIPEAKRHIETYAAFVKENMAVTRAHYATSYTPVEFIVDMDGGSIIIHDLIDPGMVAGINTELRTDAISCIGRDE